MKKMFHDGIFLKGLFAVISLLLGLIGFGSTHVLFKIEAEISKTQTNLSTLSSLLYENNIKLESIRSTLTKTDSLVSKIDDIQRQRGERIANIEANLLEIKQQMSKKK